MAAGPAPAGATAERAESGSGGRAPAGGTNGAADVPSALQVDTARAIVTWIVRNDLAPGFHLKERKFCDAFGLSRSPVRGALTLLRRHGVVEQRPDRGFFLLRSGQDLAAREPVLPPSGNDELYRLIAAAWFNGEIPDSISTAALRRRYAGPGQDVGRALERLAEDGVVVRSAGKGWRLGPNLANEAAFRDSYAFRAVIEPAAILQPTFRLEGGLTARCRRRHERIFAAGPAATVKEMVDADLEFHHLIAVSCGNQFLAGAIMRQNALRRLTEMLTTPEGTRLMASSAEHLGILDALERGRWELAALLMREHLAVSQTFSPDFLAARDGAKARTG